MVATVEVTVRYEVNEDQVDELISLLEREPTARVNATGTRPTNLEPESSTRIEFARSVIERAQASHPMLVQMATLFDEGERFTLDALAENGDIGYDDLRNLMYRSLGKAEAAAGRDLGTSGELLSKEWSAAKHSNVYWLESDIRRLILDTLAD